MSDPLSHRSVAISYSCFIKAFSSGTSSCACLVQAQTHSYTNTHIPPSSSSFSPLCKLALSTRGLTTFCIPHMDLWMEDKNMFETFDVDSVSERKSLIITIPLATSSLGYSSSSSSLSHHVLSMLMSLKQTMCSGSCMCGVFTSLYRFQVLSGRKHRL